MNERRQESVKTESILDSSAITRTLLLDLSTGVEGYPLDRVIFMKIVADDLYPRHEILLL